MAARERADGSEIKRMMEKIPEGQIEKKIFKLCAKVWRTRGICIERKKEFIEYSKKCKSIFFAKNEGFCEYCIQILAYEKTGTNAIYSV